MSAWPPVSQSRSFFCWHSMRLGARTRPRVSREKIRKTGLCREWGETCLMLSWCFLPRPGPGVGPGSVRAVIWVMEGRPGHCTTRGNIHKITPQKNNIFCKKKIIMKFAIKIKKCPHATKVLRKRPVSPPSQCCMHVTLATTHHTPSDLDTRD